LTTIEVDLGPAPSVPPAPAPAPRQAPAAPRAGWFIPRPTLPSLHTLYSVVVTVVMLGSLAGWQLPAVSNPFRTHPAGPMHATLVYDADADDPSGTAAAVKADATVATRLADLRCAWRDVDKDDPAAARVAKYTAGKAYPVLVVQEDGRTPAYAGPAPADGDGVVAKVKEIRGVK
jgi:hypothetical protein